MKFVLAVLLLLTACSVDHRQAEDGCNSDIDCRFDRVCLDRICTFSEDAAMLQKAEGVARDAFLAATVLNLGAFSITWPGADDYTWGFDFSDGEIGSEDLQAEFIAMQEDLLTQQLRSFADLRDWSQAEFVDFEPGSYAPIPAGKDRARRGLDSLRDSKLRYRIGEEEGTIEIDRLIRLRGRWRLFSFVE